MERSTNHSILVIRFRPLNATSAPPAFASLSLNHIDHDNHHYRQPIISPGETSGRNQRITPVAQDEARRCVQIVGALRTLREIKTQSRLAMLQGKTAHDAQKKKLSARQKVDKSGARLSAVDYVTEFQQLTSTSTATASTLNQ